MSLTSPLTMLLAWVVVPGLVAALSWGVGAGLQAAAGLRLRALTLPVGFVAAMGVAASLLKLGLSGTLTIAAVALSAAAWPVIALVRGRRLPPGPHVWLAAAAGAVAAYLVGIAPLIGSGRTGVVGYTLSNDPAVHLSVVALLVEHGAQAQPPASSLDSVSSLFQSGYPLGSYVWSMVATGLTGVDAFHLWTPMIALSGAMTALAAHAALRLLGGRRRSSAAGGALVACGYLPFAYLAQGGAKEVMLATAVTTAVAAFSAALSKGIGLRTLVPAALSVTGAVAVFGPGALAMLGPPAVVAAVIALRPGRRTRLRRGLALAGAAVLSVALAGPALIASARFVNDTQQDTRDPNEIGNLVGPVPVREVANVWLAADYRFPEPDERLLTALGGLLAAALAIAGLVWSLRRRAPTVPLLLLGASVAAAYAGSRYSAYFTAKTFVVLGVAVGLASAAGLVALVANPRLRRAGIVLGAAYALFVLASDAHVYRGAWITPRDRFQELVDLDARYAEKGPALVVEQEDYAKYLLRHTQPSESWGFWQPDRGLLPSVAIDVFHSPEFDDYRLEFLQRFQLLIERKRPGASRPPSGFRQIQETAHYRVWQRSGPLPEVHLGVRRDEYDGTAPLNCEDPSVKELLARAGDEDRGVRALVRDAGVTAAEPARWAWFTPTVAGPGEDYVTVRDKLALTPIDVPPGRYEVWLRGQLGPGARVLVGDAKGQVGDVYGDVGAISQWQHVGGATVTRYGEPVFVRGLGLPAWRAGGSRSDAVGAIAFTRAGAEGRTIEVPPARLRSLCGRSTDWLELP